MALSYASVSNLKNEADREIADYFQRQRLPIIDECFRAAGRSYNCTMVIETSEALNKAVKDGLGCTQSRDKRIDEIQNSRGSSTPAEVK